MTGPLRLLAVIGLFLLCGCREDLYTGLDEREANMIVATLQREGIPTDRILAEDGTMTVTVDPARFSQAMGLLEQAGLPRQKFASMGDVFGQEGLVASPMQERARLLFALSEELSRTVSEIDGVLSARVHIVLPENDALRRDAQPSSASVFIRHEGDLDIALLIPQIKTLVANGISGLTYDKVSVVPVAAAPPASDVLVQPVSSVLGIWVLDSSRSRAIVLIGMLSALSAALAIALAWALWRRRTKAQGYRLEVLE